MGFKYLYVPCSPNEEIKEFEYHEDILSLEKDSFREHIESLFRNNSEMNGEVDKELLFKQLKERSGVDVAEKTKEGSLAPEMLERLIQQTSVEIFPVMMPTKDTGFHAISFYCDDKGVAKNLEINARASSIAQAAGYPGQQFRGDIYIGRVFDDNEDEWKRIDFSKADMHMDAEWITMTKKQRSKASAGSLQQMAHQFGANNPANINPSNMVQDDPKGETNQYTWRQQGDEVEVTFKKEGLKKGDKHLVKAIFTRTKVKVVVGGEVLLAGEMFGTMDADACVWTLSDGVLQVTLTKEDEASWPTLLK